MARLQQDLAATEHFARVPQFGVYHDGQWTGLSLCSEGGDAFTTKTGIVPTGQPFAYTEVIRHTPYFRELLDGLDCPKRSVRLLHLPPGARIERHSDPPLSFQHGILRLHVPVRTHPDLVFVINDHRCVWAAGELWWGNFTLPHYVYNESPINRVHMVIDVEINAFVLSLFPDDFRRAEEATGIPLHRASISLSPEELARFACEITIPPGTLPIPPLRAGANARLDIVDRELVMMVGAQPVFRLRPVTETDACIVGWSAGVTLHYEFTDRGISSVELVVKGLPRDFLNEASEANPVVPIRRLALPLRRAAPIP